MKITVNGENMESKEGISINSLLKTIELDKDRVAVELNANIVPKSQLDKMILKENDRLEIVTFVGGG